jgi:hypothetical protein
MNQGEAPRYSVSVVWKGSTTCPWSSGVIGAMAAGIASGTRLPPSFETTTEMSVGTLGGGGEEGTGVAGCPEAGRSETRRAAHESAWRSGRRVKKDLQSMVLRMPEEGVTESGGGRRAGPP